MVYYCYLISNVLNGKKYVGFAVDPTKRWNQHKNTAIKGKGFAIHEAIRKHGVENFTFEVICCGSDKLSMLSEVEPLLIRQHHSHVSENGYNLKRDLCGANLNTAYGIRDGRFGPKADTVRKKISDTMKEIMKDPIVRQERREIALAHYANGGVGPMKGRKHSPESIRRMSVTTSAMVTDSQREQMRQLAVRQWQTAETRERLLRRIKNPSSETRHKMSLSKKGLVSWNKGLKWSSETIERMRLAHSGKTATAETRQKMSAAIKRSFTAERRQAVSDQMKGHIVTESSKRKIGRANGSKQAFFVLHPDGKEEIVTYLSEFCRTYGINSATARAAAKNGNRTKMGFTFQKSVSCHTN